MTDAIYYEVTPFERVEGRLVSKPPIAAQDSAQAMCMAARLAPLNPSVVVTSRSAGGVARIALFGSDPAFMPFQAEAAPVPGLALT